MPKISFLRPIDQPLGKQRLLEEFKICLESPDYRHFRFVVAFAKSGPLFRLLPNFEKWRAANRTIEGIFGIDHLGTSRQALEFALENFDRVFIVHIEVPLRVTFHPKLYLFSGDHQAVCFYGSHNLTVGGTETNFEGGVKIEFERPEDDETFIQALDCWESLLPERCKSTRLLDEELLDKLSRGGFLLDESKGSPPSRGPRSAISLPSAAVSTSLFPLVPTKPPSAIPRNLTTTSANRKGGTAEPAVSTTEAPVPVGYNAAASRIFVIQIIPHTNGEVHLSKIAIDQNPSFFDYPFAGLVVPKKSSNPPYHQRLPDPRVDIKVYDANGELILQKVDFPLNTVYYDDNAELRVTISPDLIRVIPPYTNLCSKRPF